MTDISTFIGGLDSTAVVITGYAAIVVAVGVACEALGVDEEKAFSKPVRKQLRTIGGATKALGGIGAATSATIALAGAKELQPIGPWIAWGLLAIVVVGFGLIAWHARKSNVASNSIGSDSTNQTALECSVCGHSVATIHTVTPNVAGA
jgi:hypothetical protein